MSKKHKRLTRAEKVALGKPKPEPKPQPVAVGELGEAMLRAGLGVKEEA